MIIKKVEVETISDYAMNYSGDTSHKLILKLPLPGGKAVYEIPISKEMKDNLETATQLTT